jgi:hypothetical protein
MLIGLVGVERISGIAAPLVACTVSKAGGQLDPTSASPINFSVVFASPVSGFDGLAINFAGSTAGGPRTATVSGSGTTYNVAVTGMTTSGDIAITVVSGYTTPPNSLSTSADNTVAWLGATGGWQTIYSQPLTTNSDGWGSYTMRAVIQPGAYSPGAPAIASALRITINASATSALNADHVRVGHAAPTGDVYDNDGTQTAALFSGGTDCIGAAGAVLLSDSISYNFDKTKPLVVSAHIVSGGIQTAEPLSFVSGNYKDTGTFDDTVTTDASGYLTIDGRLYAVSKIEGFTSTGPTLQALVGARYAEADAFGAHTVTLAATQSLTATRYTGDDAFAAHTVSATGATQTLTATRYAESDAFPTHTVSPGAVGLSAARYTGDDAFGVGSAVLNTQILTAARYTGDDAFATHTISAPTGAWYTLFDQTLTTDSNGWGLYCVAQYIAPAAYDAGAPATGTKLRVSIRTASSGGISFVDSYVGHTATSGDVLDFDGTQTQPKWSGSASGTAAASTTKVSDDITYAFNKTKGLVFRMTFANTTNNIARLDGTGSNYQRSYASDSGNNWPPVTNIGPFDAVTWDTIVNGIYLVTKVEVFG